MRTRIIIIHVVMETEKRELRNPSLLLPVGLELELYDRVGFDSILLVVIDLLIVSKIDFDDDGLFIYNKNIYIIFYYKLFICLFVER
jgi:hypothetical protein